MKTQFRVTQIYFALQVSWVRRKEEQLHLITFGASTYISDSRYSLEFKQPNDWQLHIQYANERDEGQFECQISTSPPLILIIYLEVIGKTQFISGHQLKVRLTCCSERDGCDKFHSEFFVSQPVVIKLVPKIYSQTQLSDVPSLISL